VRARRLAAAVLALSALAAGAQEFRALNPIRTPKSRPPEGAVRVVPPAPVPQAAVEDAVRQVMAAWNTPDLAKHLGGGFYDRSRLADAVASVVPRDAALRVLSIQGVQLLDQYDLAPAPGRPFGVRVSQVSVTVRTQVEFNDAAGFQALDGTNEYVIDVKEALP